MNLNVDEMAPYIAEHSIDKPVVVHLTSSDRNCGHCIASNAKIQSAQKGSLSGTKLVQVEFNPWRSLFNDKQLQRHYHKKNIGITGLPTVFVFYKGAAMASIAGKSDALVTEVRDTLPLIEVFGKPVVPASPIPRIDVSEYFDYVAVHCKNKPLVVHLTSDDGSSIHCERSNAFFDLAYDALKDDYNFVEVVFNPWTSIGQHREYLTSVSTGRYRVTGLPYTLFYVNNKIVSSYSGVMPNIEKDLLAAKAYFQSKFQ